MAHSEVRQFDPGGSKSSRVSTTTSNKPLRGELVLVARHWAALCARKHLPHWRHNGLALARVMVRHRTCWTCHGVRPCGLVARRTARGTARTRGGMGHWRGQFDS